MTESRAQIEINAKVNLIQQISEPLFSAKGWMKFLGGLSIALGSLIILFGIPFFISDNILENLLRAQYGTIGSSSIALGFISATWLGSSLIYLWIGSLLWKTATGIESARSSGKFDQFMATQDKIRLIFRAAGITTLILIVVSFITSLLILASSLDSSFSLSNIAS